MSFVLLLLAACTGGEESGLPSGTPSITGLDVKECATSDSGAGTAESFTATDAGGGDIAVVHDGYIADCCLSFDVGATVSGSTVTVEYTPVGDPCDCRCSYDLAYTIDGVGAGTWTVDAPGENSAEVTVAG